MPKPTPSPKTPLKVPVVPRYFIRHATRPGRPFLARANPFGRATIWTPDRARAIVWTDKPAVYKFRKRHVDAMAHGIVVREPKATFGRPATRPSIAPQKRRQAK